MANADHGGMSISPSQANGIMSLWALMRDGEIDFTGFGSVHDAARGLIKDLAEECAMQVDQRDA